MGGLEGMRLGNFVMRRRISSGGMGDVYLAEQAELGRTVAIKVIRDDDAGDTADAQARARVHLQFSQEAKAVAALEHPHILPIYDLGDQDGINYLVMQYIRDGSLADLLASGPLHRLDLPVAPTLAAEIIRQAADGIQFAHDCGIIHRDIKPHNLLVRVLSSEGDQLEFQVLLADFGLARFMAEMTRRTSTLGTPLYSAPEQYQGRPVPATDQYALACVAYLLLAGQPVFDGTVVELHHQHLSVAPPPISQLNTHLPPPVDAVFARALAKEPTQRYPRIRDFARALEAALEPILGMGKTQPVEAPSGSSTAQPAPAPFSFSPAPLAPPTPPSVAPPSAPLLSQSPIRPRIVSPPSAESGESGAGARASSFGTGTPARRPNSSLAGRQTPSAGRHEPDAPGAPIPRRALRRRPTGSPPRISKRARSVGLAAILLLASVGTIGFVTWKRSQLPPFVPTQTVQVIRSGQVDVAALPRFTDGQQPAQATLAVRTSSSGAQGLRAGTRITALPDATQAATWPGSRAAPTIQTKFGLGQDQVGIDTPMSASLASGDQYTVEAVDGAIQIYGHDGISDPDTAQIAAASLFAPVLQHNDHLGQPRVLFDTGTQRWVIVMNETKDAAGAISNGYFDVAISRDARPFTSWSIYQLSTQITGYVSCTYADAPQVGSDGYGIYLTGNVFQCGADGVFEGTALWDLPKKAFLTGGATTIYRWFGQFNNAQHEPVFSISPAVESATDTTEWLVSNDTGYLVSGKTSKQVIVWAILDTSAVDQQRFPTLVGLVVSLPSVYAEPPSAFQPGTSVPLSTGDARVTGLQLVGGHLYGAFTTAVNWHGDSTTRTGIYWFDLVPRIRASETTKIAVTVHQAGIFGFSNTYLLAPALAANAAGDVVLGAGVVSPGLAPGMLCAWRHAGDPLNQLGVGQQTSLLASGATAYTGPHWGDYTGVALGTSMPGGHIASIWAAGAYMEDRPSHWQTLVWELAMT